MSSHGQRLAAKWRTRWRASANCLAVAAVEDAGTARVVSTIDKWIAEKPEFSGAIKEGREIADA